MKKIVLLGIISVMMVAVLALTGCSCSTGGGDNTNTTKKEEAKPFVEENNMQITPASTTVQAPAYCYATDGNDNEVEVPGLVFESTNASYRLYDYQVVEQNDNGYQTISYKTEVTVPMKMTLTGDPGFDWKYTNNYLGPNNFDYYTGDKYKNNSVYVKSGEENTNKEFKYADITFNDKTYQIGVRSEKTTTYDGRNKVENADGSITYTDTTHIVITYFIYAPKDFDGVMWGLHNSGTTKEVHDKNVAYNKKYDELKAQADAGQPSEEYNQMQVEKDKVKKVNQSTLDPNLTYNISEFYVIRVNDIPKAGQQ